MLQHTKLVSTWKGSCKPFCTIMPLTFLLNFFLHNHASYILASCFYAENSHIFNTFTWTWPDFFSLLCSFLFAALGYPFTNCCVHTYHHLHVNYMSLLIILHTGGKSYDDELHMRLENYSFS